MITGMLFKDKKFQRALCLEVYSDPSVLRGSALKDVKD
jgi:hypothetical protein